MAPHVVVTGIKESFSPTRSLKSHARQELPQIELLAVQKQVQCFLVCSDCICSQDKYLHAELSFNCASSFQRIILFCVCIDIDSDLVHDAMFVNSAAD